MQNHYDSRSIEPSTLQTMLRYEWPGNVRELFNTLEQLRLFNQGKDELASHNIMVDSIF